MSSCDILDQGYSFQGYFIHRPGDTPLLRELRDALREAVNRVGQLTRDSVLWNAKVMRIIHLISLEESGMQAPVQQLMGMAAPSEAGSATGIGMEAAATSGIGNTAASVAGAAAGMLQSRDEEATLGISTVASHDMPDAEGTSASAQGLSGVASLAQDGC